MTPKAEGSKFTVKLLGDVLTLQRGFDLPSSQRIFGSVPIVSSSGITGFHSEAKLSPPGIVTGRYGTIGEVFFINEDYWPLNTTLFVKDFKGNDPKYLAYLLETLNIKELNSAGAVPGVNRNHLHQIKVNIPKLPIQQKIAHILSAYDDLIENNLKRIKLLEEMAQITYEEWFVRMKFPGHEQAVIDSETGLPEGWVDMDFGSVFNINNGYAFKSRDYVDDGVPILRTRDYSQTKWINTQQPIYISTKLSDKYTKYYVQEYDLMLIMVGASIGSYGIVLPKDIGALQNQNQWAIRTNKGFENYMFFKLLMMERLIQNLLARKTGAARDFFRASFLKELEVLIPDSGIIDDFNQIIEPVFKGINNLHIQNQHLKEARDILLPRLMTGMIDVNTLDVIVPTLQRGNAAGDAPASRNAERSSMSSHGDRGNYEGGVSEL